MSKNRPDIPGAADPPTGQPREHLRAAQAAELRGDSATAIAELRLAARLYGNSGSSARALQLLRYARTLDPDHEELSEELRALEQWEEQASEVTEAVLVLTPGPEEQAERQRLIQEALQQMELHGARDEEPPHMWALEESESDREASMRPLAPEERDAEPSLIERGPTRADPAIEAWCSFCCRPQGEVGELVAGPTGSFICATCLRESHALLGLEGAAPAPRTRPSRRRPEEAGAFGLVGQQEARALLERGLEAGARRVLVLGPSGCGKTVWFQELSSRERGDLVTVDALEQGSGGTVALVEDVDRLPPEAQARLDVFLARHPERTVVMSARGNSHVPHLKLRGATGSLPVFTTGALSEAVGGALPIPLLEQIQLALPLQAPTDAEFIEIARRHLAPRGDELSLADEVLAAFAAQAARSPRAGHELSALLARVLPGSWRLERAARKGRAKPARKGRRKGSS